MITPTKTKHANFRQRTPQLKATTQTQLLTRLGIRIRRRTLTTLHIIPYSDPTRRVSSLLHIRPSQLHWRRARKRSIHIYVPRSQNPIRERLVEVLGVSLTEAVGEDLGLVEQGVEGVCGIEW